jgi:hypothetical protein
VIADIAILIQSSRDISGKARTHRKKPSVLVDEFLGIPQIESNMVLDQTGQIAMKIPRFRIPPDLSAAARILISFCAGRAALVNQ